MASSPTTVASTTSTGMTNDVSTALTEQMMMLEIDDIDETNCSPCDYTNHESMQMDFDQNNHS